MTDIQPPPSSAPADRETMTEAQLDSIRRFVEDDEAAYGGKGNAYPTIYHRRLLYDEVLRLRAVEQDFALSKDTLRDLRQRYGCRENETPREWIARLHADSIAFSAALRAEDETVNQQSVEGVVSETGGMIDGVAWTGRCLEHTVLPSSWPIGTRVRVTRTDADSVTAPSDSARLDWLEVEAIYISLDGRKHRDSIIGTGRGSIDAAMADTALPVPSVSAINRGAGAE